jgi:hypothetical protein
MRYLLVLFLAGCAAQSAERAVANYGPYCDGLGFQRGTDAWGQCVQTQAANTTAASQGAVRNMQQRQSKP